MQKNIIKIGCKYFLFQYVFIQKKLIMNTYLSYVSKKHENLYVTGVLTNSEFF
jgi:hypothetical protein